MTFRSSLALASAIVMFGLAGCSSLPSGGLSSIFQLPPDQRDPTEEDSHEHDYVGREARGNRPVEKNTDPWWLDFRSATAKSIDRNCGIE